MKQFKLTIAFLLMSVLGFSQADGNITFRVDMNSYGAAFTTPEVNGTYNGWCGGCNQLSDPDLDGVWEGTFLVPGGTHEYIFAVDSWADQEVMPAYFPCTANGNANRALSVDGDAILDLVCWNSCCVCADNVLGCTDPDAANYNGSATCEEGLCIYDVTFSVDMAGYGGAFTTPEVNGTYNGWCGGCNPLVNVGGTVWEGTFQMGPGDQQYKFAHDAWLGQENLPDPAPCTINDGGNINRVVSVTGATVIPTVCWDDCVACPPPVSCVRITGMNPNTGDVTLTNFGGSDQDVAGWHLCYFPLYTDISSLTGATNITAGGGTLTVNWGGMAGADGECGLYTTNANFGDGANMTDYAEWGFSGHQRSALAVSEGYWNAGDFVTGNPTYNFTGDCPDYGSAFWSGSTDVTFEVDMNNETVSANGVHVAGSFNGWDAAATQLTDPDTDGIYSVTLTLTDGVTYEYKYINGNTFAENEIVPAACGVDDGFGAFNRAWTPSGISETIPVHCFAGCGACGGCTNPAAFNYDPGASNDDGSCVFVVDFAVDMNEYAPAFTILNVSGEWNAWCADCNQLTDPDLDGIWTGSINLPEGDFVFKYQVDSWTDQEFFAGGESCTLTEGGNTNRTLSVPAGPLTLDQVCWASCYDCTTGETPGCTNVNASNYNGAATVNDGSCLFDITFQLDMNAYGAAFTTPEVNGQFNGWCGGCNPLADPDLDNVWELTIELQEGYYEFKYALDVFAPEEIFAGGESCTTNNFGFINRYVQLTDDLVMDIVCWESCDACVSGCTDPAASNYNIAAIYDDGSCVYPVTFTVDMNEYAPAFTIMNVSGDWNGFCADCNQLTDPDLDGIWTGTIDLMPGDYVFKYQVDSWTDQENFLGTESCTLTEGGFTNRTLSVPAAALVLDPVCWNSCYDCTTGETPGCNNPNASNFDAGATVNDGSCLFDITFQVDMNAYGAAFTLPEVNGQFNGWCGGCNPLADPDLDGVWTTTIELQEGYYEFKYALDVFAPQENFVGGESCTTNNFGFINRYVQLTDDLVLDVVCWESCDECPAGPVNVTFRVDMSNEVVDPAGVHIAGSFQGWDPAGTPMTYLGFGIWEIDLLLNSSSTHEYKFVNGDLATGYETVSAPCEVNGNRGITVAATDQVVGVVCFSSCDLCDGCTDPLDAEYNPFAGADDGSCANPLVYGCTYPDADNYNPSANEDDGSCICAAVDDCPEDINGDLVVTTADLLALLAAFGSICP